MRFVFRVEANQEIGTGHFMRNLSIMQELILLKFPVVLVGHINQVAWLEAELTNFGFEKIYNSERDFMPNKSTDVLILDSYSIPIENSFIKPDKWKHVIVVADKFTPNYRATIKIFPSFNSLQTNDSSPLTLFGSKFIPIRKGISRIDLSHHENKLQICVVGGGVDTRNFVPALSKVLNKIPGDFDAFFFTNNQQFVVEDTRFKIFEIGKKLDKIANNCGLAFTTASTTAIEFIARGSALGVACAFDNQESYYKDLIELGICKNIGAYRNSKWVLDAENIKLLVESKAVRMEIISKAKNIIDLKGTERIISEILALN